MEQFTMTKLSKIAKLFAVSGIAFTGVATVDTVAFAKALEAGSPSQLQDFIVNHSKSPYVGEAILLLAKNGNGNGNSHGGPFKAPGDKGRPDIFGPPGPPVIGPPGQYFG
jgi:hypothetical protein